MNTSQITQLCLLFVGLHLLALPAFVWAAKRRQLTLPDRAVYEVIDDMPEAAPALVSPSQKWRLRLMLSVIGAMFALMFLSTLGMLHAAYSSPSAPGPEAHVSACPLGFK